MCIGWSKVKVDGREGEPEADGCHKTGGYVHTEETTGRWS